MPLFNRSRSSSSHQHQHQSHSPAPSNNRPSSSGGLSIGSGSRSTTPSSSIHSPSSTGIPPPSSPSRSVSSPSSLLSSLINRKRSSSASLNKVNDATTTTGPSKGNTTPSPVFPVSPSMAAPEAAKAYLAALAARSSSSSPTSNSNAQRHNSSTSTSSSSGDDISSSFSDVSSMTWSNYSSSTSTTSSSSSSASSAISSAATSLASSLPSPSSLLKRKRNNTQSSQNSSLQHYHHNASHNASPNGTVILGRKRGLSESLASLTHPNSPRDKIIYSNDYHIPITQSEAVEYFSKYPPKNANKLIPTRHFDDDPFYVPEHLKDDPSATRHSEFGHNNHTIYIDEETGNEIVEKWEYKSQYRQSTGVGGEEIEEPSHFIYLTTYMSYLLLIVIGHLRDFIGKRTHRKSYQHLMPYNGYAALNSDFDSFYTRRLKARIEDLFARPVTGVAGRTITCLDRVSLDHYATFRFTGLTTQALNISSYNYLGFNQSKGGCADAVEEIIKTYGVSSLGNREDVGTLDLHIQAERLISKFLGVEDSLLISQGFATNSATLPVLVKKGCLVISDELNHASIRFGVRLSGAVVKQYKHNDMKDLEKLLRESISQGQPRTHRPWKKIMLIVEGLYSMEGTLVDLPKILELKRKYKFYLYVDEAHSVGALGPKGRGVCDYFNINPKQIDILMGTLTKSFGAAGGYIAGSKSMIDEMRRSNHSSVYGEAHSPAVLMQIISAIVCIMGREALEVIPGLGKYMTKKMLDGTEGLERLRRLAFNSRYLSTGLRKLGFIVYGHRDSPIVPLLMFSPGKMGSFSRLMLEKFNIVTVVVAYPATPLVSSRVRFCVSAAHTKEDIDRVLIACDVIGDVLGLKLSSQHKRMKIDDIIKNARMLVESNEV